MPSAHHLLRTKQLIFKVVLGIGSAVPPRIMVPFKVSGHLNSELQQPSQRSLDQYLGDKTPKQSAGVMETRESQREEWDGCMPSSRVRSILS